MLQLLLGGALCAMAMSEDEAQTMRVFGIGGAPVYENHFPSVGKKVMPRRLASGGDLTDSDKGQLLQKHNDYRSKDAKDFYATQMTQLLWSEELAQIAKEWSANCNWEHSYNGYGENLYASFSTVESVDNIDTLLNGVVGWYDEIQWYDYDTDSCSAPSGYSCGHYTQMVWDDVLEVGCGYATCSGADLGWAAYEYAVMMTCNYDVWQSGGQPFSSGDSESDIASACPSGYSKNDGTGLCVSDTGESGVSDSSQGGGSVVTPSPVPAPASCSGGCSLEWTVSYSLKNSGDYITVAYEVWYISYDYFNKHSSGGDSISGKYSSSYVTVSVVMYDLDDINALQGDLNGAFQGEVDNAIGGYVSGDVNYDIGAVTDSTGAQTKNDGSDDDDDDNKPEWWVWFVVILVALFIGCACGFGITIWRQRKNAPGTMAHYQQFTDFNN